jgi:methylated-DNA-protein-cysteine methyltransferase-like protein
MDGRLATGYAFGGPGEQKHRLEEEGVVFTPEGIVDMKLCFYDFT